MKIFLTVLVVCLLALCSCLPVEHDYKNTLAAVDAGAQYDADNVEHLRLVRQFYGGYGGYPGGYGGYGGGYPGGFGGGFGGSQSYASSSSSAGGGGFGNYYG
ncbi:bacteriocin microcin B17-like [Calliphora vicina]|uniref:bacteriocin microcin B17-like n=1 Tax=Calliphora vicina TaxID=7373 RepID=UPI00325B8D60